MENKRKLDMDMYLGICCILNTDIVYRQSLAEKRQKL